jgi:aminopeptidase N
MTRILAASVLLASLVLGCSHAPRSQGPDATGTAVAVPAAARKFLTMDEARDRSRQVGQVRYVLFFGVDGSHDDFEGRAVISFFWRGRNGAAKPLFIDFHGGAIQSLNINGATQTTEAITKAYDGSRIELPESRLVSGTNRIEIAFTHPYGNTGTGLHRFVDPEDQKVYLYSQAEPFDANRIFPCFDQPDLKATFELTVEAPENWAVIANMAEREVTTFDQKSSWQFPPSPLFSTYLFALHAGPYEVWKADKEEIPLRLYARESLKKHVDARSWFAITRAGLAFFGERFGIPYPFGKYDQVIVPEFPSGAMENIGAVTFSEDCVFRSKPTSAQLKGCADTILHEAAHMWFGNLVTLRWWDGLWLNESFATHAAAWALEHLAAHDPEVMRLPWAASVRESEGRELMNEKLWAYFADRSRNTHPIEMAVPDTAAAETVFDGITYSKGAAVLKQLVTLLDEEDFAEGLKRYFQAFAYRTATTSHFLKALEESSGSPLGDWRKQWLETPGMNRIEAQWSCNAENGKLESLALVQTGEPLRRHRTRVQLMYGHGSPRPESSQNPPRRRGLPPPPKTEDWVKIADARTEVRSMLGARCPDFVLPNAGDHDYALMGLDPRSRAWLRQNLSKVRSPMVRSQIWASLWHSLLWHDLPAAEFSEWFWAHGSSERDPQLLKALLKRMAAASPARASLLRWIPDPAAREELLSRLERLARSSLQRTAGSVDLQRAWWELALLSTRDFSWLEGLLDGKQKIPGLILEQDRRWEILRAWARMPGRDAGSVAARLEAELKRDPSDEGRRQALSVEAATGRPDAKESAFERARTAGLNSAQLEALASGWQSIGHEALTAPFEDRALAALLELSESRTQDDAATFASAFVPRSCSAAGLKKIEEFAKQHSRRLPPAVTRSLNDLIDEEERCTRLRARSASAQSLISSTTGQ